MVTKETGGGTHGGGESSSAHGKGASLSHHVSEQLQTFCKVVVGMAFPEGDHNALYAMADAWEEFRRALEAINAGMEKLVPQFERSMQGATAERNLEYLKSVRDGLKAEQEKAQDYAKMCRTAAADIVKTIIMFAVMLAMVLATIIALAISVFGSFAIPGTVAAARVALTQMWNALVRSISQLTVRQVGMAVGKVAWTMGKYAAANAGLMTGLDVTIQGFQKVDHKRDDIDLDSLKNSAIGGGIGGAAFGAFRGAAKVGLGMIGDDVGKRVPGWVRGIGQIGYAMTQVGGVMASNPLVNVATGGHGEFWAGALGGAAHYNTVKPGSMSAKVDDAMWKSVRGDFSWVPRVGEARGPELDAGLAGGSLGASREISEVESSSVPQVFSDARAAISSALDAPLFPRANARAMRGEGAGGSAEAGDGAAEVTAGDGTKLGRLFAGEDSRPSTVSDGQSGANRDASMSGNARNSEAASVAGSAESSGTAMSGESNSANDQRFGAAGSSGSSSPDAADSSVSGTGQAADTGSAATHPASAASAGDAVSGRPQLSVDTSSAERFLAGTSADSVSSATTSDNGSGRNSWSASVPDSAGSPASSVGSLPGSGTQHLAAAHRSGAGSSPVGEGPRVDHGSSPDVAPKATSSAPLLREMPVTAGGARAGSVPTSGGEPAVGRAQPKIEATGPDSTSRTAPESEVRQPEASAKAGAGAAVARPAASSEPVRSLPGGEAGTRILPSSADTGAAVGSGRATSPVKPGQVSDRLLLTPDPPGPRPVDPSRPARPATQLDSEAGSAARASDSAQVKASAVSVTPASVPRSATGEGPRAGGIDPGNSGGGVVDRGGSMPGPRPSATLLPLDGGLGQKPTVGVRPERLEVSPPGRPTDPGGSDRGTDRTQPEQSSRSDRSAPDRSRAGDEAAAAAVAAAYLTSVHETEVTRHAQSMATEPDEPRALAKDEVWHTQRDASTPARFSSRQLERAAGSDSATIVQVRYDVRHFEVRPGQWVLEFSVPLDIVSRSEAVAAGVRRDRAQRLQRYLDTELNQRFRWEGAGRWQGSQIHFTVEADTPSRVEPGWDNSPDRNVPVEVHVVGLPDSDGEQSALTSAQTRWNLHDPIAVHAEQYLRFLGLPTSEPGGSLHGRAVVAQLAGRGNELDEAVSSRSLHDTGGNQSQAQEPDASANPGTETYTDGPKRRNPTPTDPPPDPGGRSSRSGRANTGEAYTSDSIIERAGGIVESGAGDSPAFAAALLRAQNLVSFRHDHAALYRESVRYADSLSNGGDGRLAGDRELMDAVALIVADDLFRNANSQRADSLARDIAKALGTTRTEPFTRAGAGPEPVGTDNPVVVETPSVGAGGTTWKPLKPTVTPSPHHKHRELKIKFDAARRPYAEGLKLSQIVPERGPLQSDYLQMKRELTEVIGNLPAGKLIGVTVRIITRDNVAASTRKSDVLEKTSDDLLSDVTPDKRSQLAIDKLIVRGAHNQLGVEIFQHIEVRSKSGPPRLHLGFNRRLDSVTKLSSVILDRAVDWLVGRIVAEAESGSPLSSVSIVYRKLQKTGTSFDINGDPRIRSIDEELHRAVAGVLQRNPSALRANITAEHVWQQINRAAGLTRDMSAVEIEFQAAGKSVDPPDSVRQPLGETRKTVVRAAESSTKDESSIKASQWDWKPGYSPSTAGKMRHQLVSFEIHFAAEHAPKIRSSAGHDELLIPSGDFADEYKKFKAKLRDLLAEHPASKKIGIYIRYASRTQLKSAGKLSQERLLELIQDDLTGGMAAETRTRLAIDARIIKSTVKKFVSIEVFDYHELKSRDGRVQLRLESHLGEENLSALSLAKLGGAIDWLIGRLAEDRGISSPRINIEYLTPKKYDPDSVSSDQRLLSVDSTLTQAVDDALARNSIAQRMNISAAQVREHVDTTQIFGTSRSEVRVSFAENGDRIDPPADLRPIADARDSKWGIAPPRWRGKSPIGRLLGKFFLDALPEDVLTREDADGNVLSLAKDLTQNVEAVKAIARKHLSDLLPGMKVGVFVTFRFKTSASGNKHLPSAVMRDIQHASDLIKAGLASVAPQRDALIIDTNLVFSAVEKPGFEVLFFQTNLGRGADRYAPGGGLQLGLMPARNAFTGLALTEIDQALGWLIAEGPHSSRSLALDYYHKKNATTADALASDLKKEFSKTVARTMDAHPEAAAQGVTVNWIEERIEWRKLAHDGNRQVFLEFMVDGTPSSGPDVDRFLLDQWTEQIDDQSWRQVRFKGVSDHGAVEVARDERQKIVEFGKRLWRIQAVRDPGAEPLDVIIELAVPKKKLLPLVRAEISTALEQGMRAEGATGRPLTRMVTTWVERRNPSGELAASFRFMDGGHDERFYRDTESWVGSFSGLGSELRPIDRWRIAHVIRGFVDSWQAESPDRRPVLEVKVSGVPGGMHENLRNRNAAVLAEIRSVIRSISESGHYLPYASDEFVQKFVRLEQSGQIGSSIFVSRKPAGWEPRAGFMPAAPAVSAGGQGGRRESLGEMDWVPTPGPDVSGSEMAAPVVGGGEVVSPTGGSVGDVVVDPVGHLGEREGGGLVGDVVPEPGEWTREMWEAAALGQDDFWPDQFDVAFPSEEMLEQGVSAGWGADPAVPGFDDAGYGDFEGNLFGVEESIPWLDADPDGMDLSPGEPAGGSGDVAHPVYSVDEIRRRAELVRQSPLAADGGWPAAQQRARQILHFDHETADLVNSGVYDDVVDVVAEAAVGERAGGRPAAEVSEQIGRDLGTARTRPMLTGSAVSEPSSGPAEAGRGGPVSGGRGSGSYRAAVESIRGGAARVRDSGAESSGEWLRVHSLARMMLLSIGETVLDDGSLRDDLAVLLAGDLLERGNAGDTRMLARGLVAELVGADRERRLSTVGEVDEAAAGVSVDAGDARVEGDRPWGDGLSSADSGVVSTEPAAVRGEPVQHERAGDAAKGDPGEPAGADRGADWRPDAVDVLAKTSSVSESLQPEVGERRSGPDAHVKDGEASQTWLEPTSTGGVRIGRGSAWEPTLASIPEEAESGRQAEGERTSSVTGGLLSEHRGGAFGAARQLYRTQGIEEIWHRLRSMSERAASQAELEEFRHEVGDNLRSFQGAGKVVEFNGKQFLLKSELDWSRSTPAPGTAAGPSAEHSLSSGSSTRIEGVRAPRMTWKIFNPMVPGLFGTGGITVPTGPTTSRSHTHEVSRTSQLEVSLDAAVNAKVVSVPVSVGIAELDDRGYPTGRTEWIGGDASGANPIAVVVNVPVGLRSTGEEVPVPRSLPPALAERAATQATPGYHRGKPLTIHRAHGWGVIEQVLKLVGKLDTESQKHLRLFLSDENIESKLPEMAVSPQDAAVGKGWVTSDALSRGGNPVKRLLSSRVHKVQMRAVARKVTYLEHVGRARFEEVQSESAGRSASATVDRSVSAAYGAGPGYDLGAMSTGAGPHAESERGRSHTQTYERGDTGVSSRSYEGTVVRYRTVYDLEVRSPGQTPVIFSHALDAVHWAKSEDAERAGIHPGNEGASSGKDRTEVLSPVESAESVAPGAALALTDASELLSGVLRDSAKEIPGHRRWAWRDSTFIGDFGDSRLARGLSGRHERELGRGEEIDRALSPESLARRAPNLLTDQPLTVELTPEHGRAHDYHAAFRVEASLEGGLVDLGPADRATGPVKLSSNETGGRQQATHWSLGGGVLARVYTSLAGSSGILTSAHRVIYSRSRGTGYEEGTTLTTGGTRGVTLDEAGKVHPERVRRYEATVKLTVTGTHWSRHNELVRGVSFGRRGLDVPAEHRLKIVDESAEAQGREPGTVRVKVELELPESHPLPGYETKPVRSEELPDVPPHTIRDLSGTGSRESDGIRVVGMSGLGFVRDSIRSMLVKASGDPIFASRDGSNSALIDRTISIESARNDLRLFNRPTRVSGLQWKRRRADVVADVAVSHQLRDPVVLATVWEDHESGVTSTSTTSRDVSSAWKVTNSVEPVYLPISADSLTGAGTKIRGMGALLHELSYWVSTFSRRTGHATIVSNAQTLKGEPRKLYLVQANVETTVAVETRRHGNIDRWQLAELFPKLVPDRWRSAGEVRRAAERLELPEAARVLVTEAQLRDIEMQQAKADTERATASPHEANQKEPAGPTDLLPIPPGRELGGGRWTDGVIKPVDLIDAAAGKGRDLLAELHAQVTQRLGKDLADRLLPDSSLATEHDNLQEVQRYLSNVQGVLPDLANGGARTTLRLEDRLRGKTYELRLSAKALETPQPVGIRHGELRKTSKVTVTNTAARGIKRVLAEFTTMLVPNAMLQSAAAEEASHTPGQRHGAPYTNLGLGMAHVFEWLQQSRETTRGEANESESRETVRGALVERNLDVDFDVEIGRHGERIAATQVTARVTGTSIVEDHAAAPDGPVRGEVVKQEAEDATNAGMADWYEARDAEALPSDPAQFRITGFDGSRDDLVEGARRALVESGVEPDRSTLGLLRDMLTPGRIEKLGGLPSRDGVELELPAELGLRLKLYSTTRGPGRLTGASARITLGGGTEANRSTHVENGHDNAHAVFATPLIAAGVPQAPEHATYAKGREAFGTIAHWGVPMEALGASADGSEYSRSTKSGGGALPEGAEKPPAEALTSTWSYPTEFRFVAEPTSKLTRNRPAVVDVSFPTGYHVRRADRTHLIPGEVARRARELAQRDREWSVARDLVRAEEATARSKSRATGEDAPTGDRLEEFRASAAHAETKWWQAVEAYQAAWPSSEPDVRLIFGTDAKAVSPAQRVTVRRLATNIMREQLRGTDPKIRFRVKGTRGQSTVQLAPIADELAKALDRMQRHLPVQDRFDLEQFGGTRDVQFIDFPEPSVVEIWLDKSPDSPEPRGTLESSLSSGEPTAERDTGAGMSTGRPGEAAGHAETGDNGGDQRTRGAGLAPEEFRSESGEQGSATSVLRRVEVLSAHEPASQVRTDVVRASDIVFVPLTHQDTISGVFFPGPGEASVVQKAFERREEDHDAYATVLHHDEDGFSIWLTSGEQVTISEKSLFRLMTGGALPGGDLWRQRRRQIVLACLVADPSLSDSAGRTPLDQLRGMLRDDGYAGSVEGPVAHVSVREDGRFTRQVHDVPNPTTDAPRLANVPETAWGGDGRDAGNPTGPAAGIFDRKERTDVVGKLRGEAADPALRSVTLGPPRRDIAAVGNDIETAGHSASGEQPRPVPLRPTSTSVGGLGFGTGAVGGAEWDRIHAGMPGRPDGAETMHVYVAGKEGKFLVEDKMVGGRELAEYVRNSGALDRVDPGTSIFLALAGEHPNPAFRRELEQEGREFARELRRDRPFFQAGMSTTAMRVDGDGRSRPGEGGRFITLPTVLAEDVDWKQLTGAKGPFGMGFQEVEPLVRIENWEGGVDESTLRTVKVKWTTADGNSHEEYRLAAWAATTDGSRVRPKVLVLELERGKFRAPLVDGDFVAVSPKEMAALLAESSMFRELTVGPVRPPLILLTYDPTNFGRAANVDLIDEIRKIIGPLVTYDYSGEFTFNEESILEIPEQGEFVAGMPPRLDSVKYFSNNRVFGFPVEGSSVTASKLAGLSSRSTHGGRFAKGVPDSPLDPLVVMVDSLDGRSARLELGLPGFAGLQIEIDGAMLGEMLLQDPQVRRSLEEEPLSQVIVVAKDAGNRTNYGGLAFDLASTLRKHKLFNEVYAPDEGLGLHEESLPGAERFMRVSNWRSGDIEISPLADREGRPVALFVRYPGDGQHFQQTSEWARNIDKRFRSAAWVFVSPNLDVRRTDGIDRRIEARDLAQILRNDHYMQNLLGRQQQRIMLTSLEGRLTVSLEDFSQGMHDGGYSRHLMSPHLPPQLTEDGKVLLDPSGMKTIDPPLLKPDDLVVEPLTSDAFGTYGHAFPRDLFDRVTASQFSQKFSPVAERIYFREISMQSDSGTSVHVAPVLTPGVTKLGDGGSRKRWYLHSHGGAGGFHAAMRTDVPFRIGDTVTLAPEEAPRLIVASEAFRQARPESVATIMFLSCRLNTFGAADAPSAAALFQDSWRSITGEDASVIAGSGRVVTQPGEGVVKVIDKGVFAQALRTGEVVDPASVIHLSDLVTTEMERVDIGFMRDSSRALAVEHEPAERVRSAVRQVVRTAAWRKRIGEPLPEIGIGVLVDNRRAGLVQQDDVRNERAGKVREIIQSEVLAEAMRLGEYGLEIGPEDIEVKRIDRPLGQASTVDPTLLPVALLAKLPVSPSLQKGRDALDRLWADEDRQEHNAYQNVLTAFAALDPGHVRGTRETSIAGARAGYEHILASDNGHDVDSSLEVDHENRVSGGPEANVRARHAGRPSPRVRARLTAESNRSDSRTRLAPSKGAQRLAPAPRGRRARTPQPPVSGRSSGPSQVPIMPKPTVFAPTAGSVGGIAFGLARGHEGEWHRIHAGMPTTAADSRPLHVYVISREGKFQVGSALVGGRELASYVRALPEVRSVAAGTPVALVLMEERPRPAFAGRLDEEGRAFARALRGNSPFFPVWLSSTVAALDAAGRTELSDGGHYKVLPTVLPQDVQWRPLTDGTDIFGVVFPGMERSMGVPDWEKWVTNIALGTVAATSVSAAGERIREYSVSEWVEAIEKDRAHPLVLAFKSARGKFDVPLEKGNVWVEPKELAALIAGASWFAGLMRMPQRPHLIFLTLDLTAADPAMNAQVLGTLRELVGPLTSHDFIGAFRFGDHAVLEYPKNGKFVESPPPPLKSLNFFSEGNVFVFPVDGSAIARPDLAQLVSGGVTVEGLPESGGPPLVMIVQSPNGRFAQVEPGGPLLVLGGDQLGVTSLEDPKFKQQVMMDAGREIVVVTGGHALAKYGWLGFDFAGALRKEGIYNPVRVVTGEVTLRDGRISGSTGLVTVSNLRAGDLKTSLLHDREGNPVALFLRFPNDGKQYRNAVGWAHNITDDLREWAWVLVGPSLEVVRRDGYAQRVNITALAQVLSNDRDFERLLSVKGRKIMLANPGGRLDISMSEFSSEMVARGYSRVTARPIGDLRLLSSGNAEMRLEEVLPALPQPEDLVVEPLRNDALGHYGTAFSKTQLDRVGAALFTKNITSMTRRVYFRQSLEEYGLLHYVRRDPVLMPKVAARENVIGNVPWFFHGHGGVDGFGVSLHKDRPYRIGDNVTLHPREAANLLAATDAFRRARPERIDTLVFSSCSINRPISGGGSTAAALFGESWRSIEVEYAETVGSTEVVASYPGMGILHVTNEGVMAPAMRARESVDLLSVVRLAELAATEIVPVAVDIPPGEFTASTVGGGAAEMVRHVVRQTMRAAAWRRRIDEPLPEITIDFHVADNRTALTQSFNAQSRHVKKIVINEMIADRERLRDYGLDIDPKDIKMNFTSNIGSLPSKANPELRSVTLTVKLPDSDSVREAHFAVDRVQDIEINHDWTSHDRVLAAFAALDPEHDSAATAGGVGRPGGAG